MNDELDTQIHAAEVRVRAADERVRARVHALAQRTRRLVPSAGSVKAIALAAGGLLLWLLAPRRARRDAAPTVASRHHAPLRNAQAATPLPWTQFLALAWPLMPATWRDRVSPTTAAGLASLALPLLARVVGADAHPPLSTMAYVDLRRYGGRWFEAARLPAPFEGDCAGQATATYRPRGQGITVVSRCVDRHGRVREAAGVARVVPGSGNARLRVSLWPRALRWLPIAWTDHWILHVDADYGAALVGHPNRRWLWILSRTPVLADERLQALVRMAAERGYPIARLRFAGEA